MRRGRRERYFARAAARTPYLAVEAHGALYFVSTRDRNIGRRLFVNRGRKEFAHLRRALDAIAFATGRPASGTVLDVGANIGTTAIPAVLDHGFERALALEPSPENYRLLVLNVHANRLADRFTALPVAASDQAGVARFEIGFANSGKHRIVGAAEEGTEVIEVETTTLDRLAEQGLFDPAEVGLLWLDVEGHEGRALEGGGLAARARRACRRRGRAGEGCQARAGRRRDGRAARRPLHALPRPTRPVGGRAAVSARPSRARWRIPGRLHRRARLEARKYHISVLYSALVSFWRRKRSDAQPERHGPTPYEIHHGSHAQREAFVGARRRRAAERDAARLNVRPKAGAMRIPRDLGYARADPGALGAAEEVVRAADELIDGIGHDAIVEGKLKSGFMATGLLPLEQVALDSPYLRFALGDEVLGAVSEYLGVVPLLAKVDVWYSVEGPRKQPKGSQLWHLDHDDTTQVKIFLHANDVTPEMGPLTIVDAGASAQFASRPGYDFGKGNRVRDEDVRSLVAGDDIVVLSGPRGSAALVDTSRCLHFGSRVEHEATPRRIVMVQYLTPYAFLFGDDPLKDAPFRALAVQATGSLQRLALGAAA